MTANGAIAMRTVTGASLAVSGITLRDVKMGIGAQGEPLIGMSFPINASERKEAGVLPMSG